MNQEMTERIAETKELVITAEWREKILACQESGKPVTAWCEENGISPSTYYRKLRMMREDILSGEQQIVPIKRVILPNLKWMIRERLKLLDSQNLYCIAQ